MDNITHTFVGAALAEAGLKRRTALGAATLMIAANFPDIDVVAVPLGYGIEWRRGITHGIPAHFILPFVLAGIILLWDRTVRLRRDPSAPPADFKQLVILSAIGIATHPALDFMNSYGMRWLMPMVNQWFYADGLFIVDIWMLAALVAAVVWSRRARTTRPARVVLAGMVAYIVANLAVTTMGRARVASQFPGRRLMVAPAPLVPWRREVVVEDGDRYLLGRYSPLTGAQVAGPGVQIGDGDPAVALAKADPRASGFLRWARFPLYAVSRSGSETVVVIHDARYGPQSWATIQVRLP